MDKSLSFLQLTTGRDRCLRILQFVLFTLRTKLPKGTLHDRVSIVISSFSTTRQVLRFGMPISMMLFLAKAVKKDGVGGLLSMRAAEMMLWLVFFPVDHLAYLCKIGIVDSTKLTTLVGDWSTRLWFYGDLLSIVCDIKDWLTGAGDKRKLRLNLLKNSTDLAVRRHSVLYTLHVSAPDAGDHWRVLRDRFVNSWDTAGLGVLKYLGRVIFSFIVAGSLSLLGRLLHRREGSQERGQMFVSESFRLRYYAEQWAGELDQGSALERSHDFPIHSSY